MLTDFNVDIKNDGDVAKLAPGESIWVIGANKASAVTKVVP